MPKYIMTVPQQCRVILVWVPPEGEFETRNSGANTSGGAGKGQYRHGNWDRDEKADHKGHVHKQVSPTSSCGSTPIQEPLKDIRQDYATHSEGRWAFTQQLSSVVGWGLRWGKTRNSIPGNSGLVGIWTEWLQQSGKVLSKWDVFWELNAVHIMTW